LAEHDAVITGKHFVYTSGLHGTAYVNMRAVAEDAVWLDKIGQQFAKQLAPYQPDIIVGPETLGRTLGGFTAAHSGIPGIWCAMTEKGAEFTPKMNFGRLVTPGTKVAITDDLLTTGSSIEKVHELCSKLGAEVVVAIVVVRRTPDVTAETCGVPALEVLAEIDGFSTFSPEECTKSGPCKNRVPMVLRPGHGHEWIKSHADYPVAA
jgi:orotate phosphoribosyltransferase